MIINNITLKNVRSYEDETTVSFTQNGDKNRGLIGGENGAGKSTIMKILYGLYHKTSGEILIDGKERDIQTPRDAMDLGICMVQQHFTLIPAQTVTENIILGTYKGRIDYDKEQHEVEELSKKYGWIDKIERRLKTMILGE